MVLEKALVNDCGLEAPFTGWETVAFISTAALSLDEIVNTEPKDPELFVTPLMEDRVFEKLPLYPFEVAPHAEWTQTWIFTGTPVCTTLRSTL